MMHKRAFLSLGAAALAAGCSDMLGPPAAAPIYALRPDFPAMPAARAAWSLAIMRPGAASALDTDRIALQQPDGVLDYYAKAQYPDALPALVQDTLMLAFERSAAIASLSREQEGLQSDYILFTDIRACEARYAVKDGVPDVVVTLGVRLVTTLGRSMAGNTVITRTGKASANSVPAVTAMLGETLGQVAAELVRWALQFPAPSLAK